MSSILYYSKNCNHCNELLTNLSKTQNREDIHFVCIDKREKNSDGTIEIILDNAQRLLLPPNIKKVPSVLLLNHGNRVLDGLNEFWEFIKVRKRYWLTPIVLLLALLSMLVMFSQSSAVAPFIYTLF